MANFDSEFFGLVFLGFQATQKIHAQNSRPELSAFLSNFTFLNPKFIHGDFLLTGETKKFRICSESVSRVFPDLFRMSLRKCLTILGAPPSTGCHAGTMLQTGRERERERGSAKVQHDSIQAGPVEVYITFGAEKTVTATDVTGFDAIFSTGFFATFSRFWGARLTKLHREPGEKAKNPVESLQWRRHPEIADFCPLSWSNLS